MKKNIILFLLLFISIICILTACGNKNKASVIDTADAFLSAAVDKDYKKAGEYATDEAMTNLGWDEMSSAVMEEVFYTSMGVSDEMTATLRADENVSAAVDLLVEKMQQDVMDYTIEKGSYEEDGDTAKLKVNVTRLSSKQLGEIFTDLQSDIQEDASAIGDELAEDEDISEEDMTLEVIKRLIPEIIPVMIEKYDSHEASQEDWILQVDILNNKITGVYESE